MTLERAPRIVFSAPDALVVKLEIEGDVDASTAGFVKSLTNITQVHSLDRKRYTLNSNPETRNPRV